MHVLFRLFLGLFSRSHCFWGCFFVCVLFFSILLFYNLHEFCTVNVEFYFCSVLLSFIFFFSLSLYLFINTVMFFFSRFHLLLCFFYCFYFVEFSHSNISDMSRGKHNAHKRAHTLLMFILKGKMNECHACIHWMSIQSHFESVFDSSLHKMNRRFGGVPISLFFLSHSPKSFPFRGKYVLIRFARGCVRLFVLSFSKHTTEMALISEFVFFFVVVNVVVILLGLDVAVQYINLCILIYYLLNLYVILRFRCRVKRKQ